MIYPIVAYGDPVLKKVCDDIDLADSKLKNLIEDMFETMYGAHGVGLAAPQIGKPVRLFVVDASPFAEEDEDGKVDPEHAHLKDFKKVFINPIVLEEDGDEWLFEEGCLSIPKIREDVARKRKLTIEYYDENLELKEESFDGLEARIIQHEYDHIEGILFTDHLKPLKRRLLKRKLTDISKGQIKIGYRMRFPVK